MAYDVLFLDSNNLFHFSNDLWHLIPSFQQFIAFQLSFPIYSPPFTTTKWRFPNLSFFRPFIHHKQTNKQKKKKKKKKTRRIVQYKNSRRPTWFTCYFKIDAPKNSSAFRSNISNPMQSPPSTTMYVFCILLCTKNCRQL